MDTNLQLVALAPVLVPLILYLIVALITRWWGSRSILKMLKEPLPDHYGLLKGRAR